MFGWCKIQLGMFKDVFKSFPSLEKKTTVYSICQPVNLHMPAEHTCRWIDLRRSSISWTGACASPSTTPCTRTGYTYTGSWGLKKCRPAGQSALGAASFWRSSATQMYKKPGRHARYKRGSTDVYMFPKECLVNRPSPTLMISHKVGKICSPQKWPVQPPNYQRLVYMHLVFPEDYFSDTIVVMEKILHHVIGSSSHHLQVFIHPNAG